jgi:hypothetical protein
MRKSLYAVRFFSTQNDNWKVNGFAKISNMHECTKSTGSERNNPPATGKQKFPERANSQPPM